MSHIPLQRVIVRMLYDTAFRSAVYADSVEALAGVAVSSEEAGWVTALDPRAYATDPHVRGRSLHGLLSEYSVSGALALRGGVDLDSFFSSDAFHGGIQGGHSLALTFGGWLSAATDESGDRGSFARIETGMAALRRGAGEAPDAEFVLAPHLRLVTVANGALGHFQAVLTGMQAQNADPRTVALDTRYLVPPVQLVGEESEFVLLEDSQSGVGAEILSAGLGDIVSAAAVGVSRSVLMECLSKHDVSGLEADGVLDGLVADGLLCRSAQGVS
jgi:hypothetical protein